MRPRPPARRTRRLGVLAAGVAIVALLAAVATTAVAATSSRQGPVAKIAVPKKGAKKKPRRTALARCLIRARKARSAKSRAARRRACWRAAARRARAARRKRRGAAPTTKPAATTTSTHNSFGSDVFGVSTGGAIQNDDAGTLARDLDGIAGTHTRWVRVDINWAQIQDGGPSSYYWTAVDRVVQDATARGMKVLGTIVYTPGWARPSGTGGNFGPDPAQYASFAATAVQHYSAMGVHAYEVWNEPNNPASWAPRPDPAAYTRVLRAAYPAIKGADPQATVVSGGTSPGASDGTQISPVDFLHSIYANGGGGSFDAVGHHPYCWPAYPGDAQWWSAWYQMYGTSPSLRSVMAANGDGAKKIWATEFGAPTNGPGGVSEADQAAMLTRAYQLYRTYDWGGPLFFYQGRDQSTDTSTRENFFGFLRADFSAKPSYSAYQQAATT